MKSNFWEGKIPCWEIGGTFCKLNTKDGSTSFIDRCYNCNVYMKYGKGEPITIKKRDTGPAHDNLLQALTKREEYEWLLKHIGSK